MAARSIREEHDMKTFIKMLRDESGAAAAEYALILALVGVGIAVTALALGASIKDAMADATTEIDKRGTP